MVRIERRMVDARNMGGKNQLDLEGERGGLSGFYHQMLVIEFMFSLTSKICSVSTHWDSIRAASWDHKKLNGVGLPASHRHPLFIIEPFFRLYVSNFHQEISLPTRN